MMGPSETQNSVAVGGLMEPQDTQKAADGVLDPQDTRNAFKEVVEPHDTRDAVDRAEDLEVAASPERIENVDPLAYVTAACGDASRAQEALNATSAEQQHPADWAEAAILHLTVRAEREQEKQALEVAMAASLEESEGQKAGLKPLREWDVAALLERFASSSVLPQVTEACHSGRPFETQSRDALIDILEFEHSSLKWYPMAGTRAYFTKLAQEAIELVIEDMHNGKEGLAKRAREGSGHPSTRPCRRLRPVDMSLRVVDDKSPGNLGTADSSAKRAQATQNDTNSREDGTSDESKLQAVVERLTQKVSSTKEEIFKMPAEGQHTPSIFINEAGDDCPDNDSDCELVGCAKPQAVQAPLLVHLVD